MTKSLLAKKLSEKQLTLFSRFRDHKSPEVLEKFLRVSVLKVIAELDSKYLPLVDSEEFFLCTHGIIEEGLKFDKVKNLHFLVHVDLAVKTTLRIHDVDSHLKTNLHLADWEAFIKDGNIRQNITIAALTSMLFENYVRLAAMHPSNILVEGVLDPTVDSRIKSFLQNKKQWFVHELKLGNFFIKIRELSPFVAVLISILLLAYLLG